MSNTATLGELVLVRELEVYREYDGETTHNKVRVKRVAPAIVVNVEKDGTAEVLALHTGGRLTPVGALPVYDEADLPALADFYDGEKADPPGLCAYRPASSTPGAATAALVAQVAELRDQVAELRAAKAAADAPKV